MEKVVAWFIARLDAAADTNAGITRQYQELLMRHRELQQAHDALMQGAREIIGKPVTSATLLDEMRALRAHGAPKPDDLAREACEACEAYKRFVDTVNLGYASLGGTCKTIYEVAVALEARRRAASAPIPEERA